MNVQFVREWRDVRSLSIKVNLIDRSNIKDSVLLVGKWLPLDAKVGVDKQVSAKHLRRHDLSLLGIYDLFPRVR